LRRSHGHGPTNEERSVVLGDAVNGVAFGHGAADATVVTP
jgi:hypothetical protein